MSRKSFVTNICMLKNDSSYLPNLSLIRLLLLLYLVRFLWFAFADTPLAFTRTRESKRRKQKVKAEGEPEKEKARGDVDLPMLSTCNCIKCGTCIPLRIVGAMCRASFAAYMLITADRMQARRLYSILQAIWERCQIELQFAHSSACKERQDDRR